MASIAQNLLGVGDGGSLCEGTYTSHALKTAASIAQYLLGVGGGSDVKVRTLRSAHALKTRPASPRTCWESAADQMYVCMYTAHALKTWPASPSIRWESESDQM
jgi:hypothetical protein